MPIFSVGEAGGELEVRSFRSDVFFRCALGTFFGTHTDDSKTQLRSFWGKKGRKS
jgi:hypothetical protein